MSQSYLRHGTPKFHPCTKIGYTKFKDSVLNQAGLYGSTVANELRTSTMKVLPKKYPQQMYEYTVQLTDGTLKTTFHDWDEAQDHKLHLENLAIERSNEEAALQRARCWVNMTNAITTPVRIKLANNCGETYEDARADNNVAALMQLLEQVCSSLATDVVETLRAKMQKFKHDHPTEHIDAYIERLNKLFKQLEEAGDVNTDADRVYKLTKSINVKFWGPYITAAYAHSKGHPSYPLWADLTKEISTIWNNLMDNKCLEDKIGESDSDSSSSSDSDRSRSKRKRSRSRKNKDKGNKRGRTSRAKSNAL